MLTLTRSVALLGLTFALCNAHAKSAADWLKEADDAAKAVTNETVTAPQGPAPGTGGGNSGCIGSNPSGRISLLGVESQMGPSTQGTGPLTKLAPDNPAMKALNDMRATMGIGAGASEAARTRASRSATYAQYLDARATGQQFNRTPVADLMQWLYRGELEAMAAAYAEQQELSRPYAGIYAAAEAAGRACP